MLKTLNVIKISESNKSRNDVLEDVLVNLNINNLNQLNELSYRERFNNNEIKNIFFNIIKNDNIIGKYSDIRNIHQIMDSISQLKYYIFTNSDKQEIENDLLLSLYNQILNKYNKDVTKDINELFATDKTNTVLNLFKLIKNIKFKEVCIHNLLSLLNINLGVTKLNYLIAFIAALKKFKLKIANTLHDTSYVDMFLFHKFIVISNNIITDNLENYFKIFMLNDAHELMENCVQVCIDKNCKKYIDDLKIHIGKLLQCVNEKYELKDFQNIKLCTKFVGVFKLINTIKLIDDKSNSPYVTELIEETRSKYNEILIKNNVHLPMYFCLSITTLLNAEDLDNIFEIIKFQKFNDSVDEFLLLYKKELIRRVFTGNYNVKLESIIINKMGKLFNENEIINKMKLCIAEMNMSKEITENLREIKIVPKKDDVFDINKLDVFVGSSVLWENTKSERSIELKSDLNIYGRIMTKYYAKRFSNRKISFNNELSYTIVSIGKCMIKLGYFDYLILNNISNGITDLDKIISETNSTKTYIINTISNLQDNNILTSDLKINESIGDEPQSINMIKYKSINAEEIAQEIHFDRSLLIDCFTIKSLKKDIEKGMPFTNLFLDVKHAVKNRFTLDDEQFSKCLEKLVNKEYVKHEDEVYYYIV